jgi:hypothetical protein
MIGIKEALEVLELLTWFSKYRTSAYKCTWSSIARIIMLDKALVIAIP